MGLPPLDELFKPVTCFPPWYARYLPFERNTPRIASGCSTVNGNVQCKPEDMAAQASRLLGRPVSLEAYTLARYLASEVGSGTLAERVSVAQNAVNRADATDLHGVRVCLGNGARDGHVVKLSCIR